MATLLSTDDYVQDVLSAETAAVTTASDRPTLIVVLGMHRGGTSVVVRAMETMGAELGTKLGAPVAGENDKGFFEDLDIVRLNEEILAAAGSSWHALAPVDLRRLDAARFTSLQDKAIKTLRDKCNDNIFALKDPRLSRLLPFWQPVFDRLSLRVRYVIAIRNPIEVGRSLQKRDGFPIEKSYLLWLSYMIAAVQTTRGKPRVFVEFSKLLDTPLDELDRVSRSLGLALDRVRASTFEQQFIDKRLQHWHFRAADIDSEHAAPRQMNELFLALLSASASGDRPHSAALEIAVTNTQRYLEQTVASEGLEEPRGAMASFLRHITMPLRALRRRVSP